jgi:hypothetical protein
MIPLLCDFKQKTVSQVAHQDPCPPLHHGVRVGGMKPRLASTRELVYNFILFYLFFLLLFGFLRFWLILSRFQHSCTRVKY